MNEATRRPDYYPGEIIVITDGFARVGETHAIKKICKDSVILNYPNSCHWSKSQIRKATPEEEDNYRKSLPASDPEGFEKIKATLSLKEKISQNFNEAQTNAMLTALLLFIFKDNMSNIDDYLEKLKKDFTKTQELMDDSQHFH